MKRTILIITATIVLYGVTIAQEAYTQQMQAAITKLDNAVLVKDYQQLATVFERIADGQKTKWLPYYYAAFSNAKIGWLKQEDPDGIEPFANKSDEQGARALSLIDTLQQKAALSEVYCILSMANRARVFMNPATYGPRYGPAASRYARLAQKANPTNPRALYLEGWEKFVTPKMWGGDKNKAKELLLAAKEELDKSSSQGIDVHWGKKETAEILKQFK